MPEGVEVKLSADVIRPLVKDRIIESISFPSTSRYSTESPDGFKEFNTHFSFQDKAFSCKIENIQNKGKFMYWTIKDDWYVFLTYGMTGQLSPQAGKHVCMKVILDDEPLRLYFNDQRHFGTIKFVHGKKLLDNKLYELGWDPLQMPLNANLAWVKWHLAKTGKGIGEVLMDQGVFAGVGNYIRAEALYLSKLSPFRPANKLSEDEIDRLCQNIVDVMEESYKYQGATIQTYKTVYGEEGKYSSIFKVYNQKNDPLGNKIIKQDSGGRTIHWCPSIQA